MSEEKLVQDFKSEIDKVTSSAFLSSKGGDDNWNKVIAAYNVVPLTQNEKESLLNSQMKITKGAFPIELRRVFEAVIMKNAALNNPALNNALSGFNIESKVLEYYQKIKPFAGMGDIFKNASNSSLTKYSQGLQKEKQMTIKCKNCGAPREEEMQYDNCLFCGSKLFETLN
jgi:hypothetical protein